MIRRYSIVLAFLGLAGCHRGPALHVSTAPLSLLPAGWTRAASQDQTVSVGVPPSWRSGADTGAGKLAQMISGAVGQSAPQVPSDSDSAPNAAMQDLANRAVQEDQDAERKALAKLAAKGIVVNVINGSRPIPGEQRTRFYVKHVHQDGDISADDAVDAERKHYDERPKPTEVKLPIGTAYRFVSDESLRDGMTLHQIGYLVIDGGDTYALRFESEEEGVLTLEFADSVAKTLNITPSGKH